MEIANRDPEAAAGAPSVFPPTWAQEMEASLLSKKSGMRQSGPPHERQATMRSMLSTDILVMPVHVPKDVDDWIRDRNLDLQDVFSVGNDKRVLEWISKLSEGVGQMSTLTGTGAMQSWQAPDRSPCMGVVESGWRRRHYPKSFAPSTTLPGTLPHAWMCHRIHDPRFVMGQQVLERWGQGRQCWRGACGASSG